MKSTKFSRMRVVEARHIDELDHVNNLVWVRWVVELAFAHSDELGWDVAAYRELGAWWIVYRQQIAYHAPAFLGEELREETWISEMRGARSVRHSRIHRAADETLLLSAQTTWVLVHASSHRPRRIPKNLLESFPVLTSRALTCSRGAGP